MKGLCREVSVEVLLGISVVSGGALFSEAGRELQAVCKSDCGRVFNFTMSRYGIGALCGRIMVGAVVSTLAKQHAAM